MKVSKVVTQNRRSSYRWASWLMAGLLAGALAGCGGGGGSATPAGGASGSGATPAAPTVPVPTGTAPIALNSNAAAGTASTVFPTLTPTVTVGGVTIDSPPTVTFSVTDGNGNAVTGLGNACKSPTMTVPMLTNIQFSLAKLVPGTGTAPSRWVNYIVMSVPTKNATTGAINPSVPEHPDTDRSGTLVDNGNGTYTYTFYTDVKQIAAEVAAATVPAGDKVADLGDLTYDPNLVHRLTIEISGAAPGTGSNTPDCSVSSTPAVPLAHPLDVIYDFIPATGKAVPVTDSGRDIVSTAKCDACHDRLGGRVADSVSAGTVGSYPPSYKGLESATASPTLNPAAGNTSGPFSKVSNNSAAAFHDGAKYDTRYCVVCHTDQQKYGNAEATLSTTAANTFTGSTLKIQDRAVGDFPNHIHKIHMGSNLVMQGYNFAGLAYNDIMYPQQITNCTSCHDGTGYVAGAKNDGGTGIAGTITAQGNDWKTVPSRKACGGCHDGINFTTGKGLTLADAAANQVPGATQLTSSPYGHVGGPQADDSNCALCHNAADIPVYHATVTPAVAVSFGSSTLVPDATPGNLPAGAYNFTYKISSVSVNSSGQPVVVFQIQNNGTPVTLNAYSATAGTEMLTGFGQSGPTIKMAFAVPQDGITAPADYNASTSTALSALWNGSQGTLTGPDASGNYTAVITGTTASPITIPSSAVMVTAFIGYSGFRQDAGFNGLDTTLYPNGLLLAAQDVQMVATGYTPRRQVVSNDKCNACHKQLGLFTGINAVSHDFHSGFNNDANACQICHLPNVSDHGHGGWPINIDYWVHSIHAAAKRTVPYPVIEGFTDIGYPGVLANCQACHLPGTYDFSAPASKAAVPDRLYTTAASGTIAAAGTATNSPYVTAGQNYGNAFSYNVATQTTTQAAGSTLVISPIMTACVACHDGVDPATGVDVKQHMEQNGGVFYARRDSIYQSGSTVALKNSESCLLCHGTGQIADIAVVHAAWGN